MTSDGYESFLRRLAPFGKPGSVGGLATFREVPCALVLEAIEEHHLVGEVPSAEDGCLNWGALAELCQVAETVVVDVNVALPPREDARIRVVSGVVPAPEADRVLEILTRRLGTSPEEHRSVSADGWTRIYF